ncbi:CMRF35-like molecule 5 [Danio aesculapii]|uniref:CMRF35-like molecule 5 n=1 Tax=Danio aesculapii TaxID=1142201 RepID=UPI0024C0D517|nr:CMRF35-like molecule 5 [Danio aesculapii]
MKLALRVCVFLLMARASVCADVTVTGTEGGEVVINCPYARGKEEFEKYIYKQPYKTNNRKLQADGEMAMSNGRFTLMDDPKARLFTVTIRDLQMNDAGLYGCAPVFEDTRLVQLNVVKAQKKPKQISTSTVNSVDDLSVHQGSGRTRIVIVVACGGLFIISILLLIMQVK